MSEIITVKQWLFNRQDFQHWLEGSVLIGEIKRFIKRPGLFSTEYTVFGATGFARARLIMMQYEQNEGCRD